MFGVNIYGGDETKRGACNFWLFLISFFWVVRVSICHKILQKMGK